MLYFLRKYLARTILYVTGWKVDLSEYKQTDRQIILVPHSSYWDFVLGKVTQYAYDIPAVIPMWNGHFRGIKGVIVKLLGCIPVENTKSVGNVKMLSDYLERQNKFNLFLCPEGTTSYIQDLRSGFFYIAQNTGADYVVGTIDYVDHNIKFSAPFRSSNNLDRDKEVIIEMFKEGKPKYPHLTFYSDLAQGETSIIDWEFFTSIALVLVVLFMKLIFSG